MYSLQRTHALIAHVITSWYQKVHLISDPIPRNVNALDCASLKQFFYPYNLGYVHMYVCMYVSLIFSSSDFHMKMPAQGWPSTQRLLDKSSLLIDKC